MLRRDFLGIMLATGCAPAIVRIESLMKIVVPSQEIVIPDLFWERYPIYNMARLASNHTPPEVKAMLRVELTASLKRRYPEFAS